MHKLQRIKALYDSDVRRANVVMECAEVGSVAVVVNCPKTEPASLANLTHDDVIAAV